MARTGGQVWVRCHAPGQEGKYYYWSQDRQGTTSWEEPVGANVSIWAREEADGRCYYWNIHTREALWHLEDIKRSPCALDWGNGGPAPEIPDTGWQFFTAHKGSQIPEGPEGCTAGQEDEPLSEDLKALRPREALPSDFAWVEVVKPPSSQPPYSYYWNYRSCMTCEVLPDGVRCKWQSFRTPEGHAYYRDVDKDAVSWTIPDMPVDTREKSLEWYRDTQDPKWLEVGAAVTIHSLQIDACQRFNEQAGVVIGYVYGKVVVRLPDVLGGTALCMESRNLRPLDPGSIVEIHGLLKLPELNGEVCTVEEIGEAALRLRVKLRAGEMKLIKPTNLQPRPRLWDIDLKQVHEWLQWRKEQNCLFIDSAGHHRHYALHLPLNFTMKAKEGGKAARPWPLLVYMHGTGGSSFFTNSKKSLKSPGLQYVASKFVVVSPACDWTWKEVPRPWVTELVNALRAAEWIDDRRIYLTGCSMGGMSTWEVSAAMPSLYSAIAPVAGHHMEERRSMIASRLKTMPTFVVHSQCDTTCPFKPEEALWRQLQDNPFLQVSLTPVVDHCTMFERAFCDETVLYDWLLRFDRPRSR